MCKKQYETYPEMKSRHQKDFDTFPIMFAFSNKQFDEGMIKLGLKPEDTDKIVRLGSTGGYIRKTDSDELSNIFTQHENDMNKAIENDTTGEGFVYSMFRYELANHEYVVSMCYEDTLNVLGYSIDDINNNPKLLKGLAKATKDYLKACNEHN